MTRTFYLFLLRFRVALRKRSSHVEQAELKTLISVLGVTYLSD